MSDGLRISLNFPSWAASEGMYPILFRYALWAIDETNVTKDVLIEYLTKHTFPALLKAGYPDYKLLTPIDHAYSIKGQA